MKLFKKMCSVAAVCMLLFGLSSANVFAMEGAKIFKVNNPNTGEYLYTTSGLEVSTLMRGGWLSNDMAWFAPEAGTPVYRLTPPLGGHMYSSDQNEINTLVAQGWAVDFNGQPAFYSGGDVDVYRACNPANGVHYFTADPGEFSRLQEAGWVGEGVSFKCVSAPLPYPDQAQVYEDLVVRFQQKYPKGTPYSFEKHYTSPYTGLSGGACGAFVLEASDYAFTYRPVKTHCDINNVKVGDVILYTDVYAHYVCVLHAEGTKVTVCEGNWSKKVNWGRTFDLKNVRVQKIMTRY